jgi:hypothetical protein
MPGSRCGYGKSSSCFALAAARGCSWTVGFQDAIHHSGELCRSLGGRVQVSGVIEQIDAIEAAGVDPCDVSLGHWRYLRLPANFLFATQPSATRRNAIESLGRRAAQECYDRNELQLLNTIAG